MNTLDKYKIYLISEKDLADSSIKIYLEKTRRFLKFLHPKNIAEVNREDLNRYFEFVQKNNVTGTTHNNIVAAIKSFLSFLGKNELKENISLSKVVRKIPEILTIEEINDFVSAIDLKGRTGVRDRAIIELLYGCGLRISEVGHLKTTDLFFDQNLIKVNGKGSKERYVPINNLACHWIKNYLKIRPHDSQYLFLTRKKGKIDKDNFRERINIILAKTNIKKKITTHTFRHTFATHLLQNGASIVAVQKMLGHESIEMTEIYTHLNTEDLRKSLLKNHPLNV